MNNAYAKNAYMNNQVMTAPQNKLIVMLYDGAIRNLKLAELLLEEDPKSKEISQSIIKAQDIVIELMTTLNFEAGGELAENLYKLYDYMLSRLVTANIKHDREALVEVREFMEELRETWAQI